MSGSHWFRPEVENKCSPLNQQQRDWVQFSTGVGTVWDTAVVSGLTGFIRVAVFHLGYVLTWHSSQQTTATFTSLPVPISPAIQLDLLRVSTPSQVVINPRLCSFPYHNSALTALGLGEGQQYKLGNTSRKACSVEEAMRDPSFLLAKYFSAPMSCKQPPPVLCQPPNSLVSQSELGRVMPGCVEGALAEKLDVSQVFTHQWEKRFCNSDKPCQVPVKCV